MGYFESSWVTEDGVNITVRTWYQSSSEEAIDAAILNHEDMVLLVENEWGGPV